MKPCKPNTVTPAADRPDRLDSVLLVIVCGITALRATCIETPHIDQNASAGGIAPELVSLLWSTALLGCGGLWLLRQILRPVFSWRTTWMGAGAAMFIAAGLIGITQASDKRAAITDLTTLIAPLAAALLAVQLLKSRAATRWILFLLLSIAAATAVVCIDQFFSSNDALVKEYQANPAEHLERLGIETGSLEHWMYEHRLHSKGVRGFLITGNSTASFFLLAIFSGIGLCAEGLKTFSRMQDKLAKEQALAAVLCYALITVLVTAGMVLTKSKGGLASLAIGSGLYLTWLVFGKWIRPWKRTLGVTLIVLCIAAAGAAAAYGMNHGRLPGGNSMLVRWQYWTSAAAMLADHPLDGVGGGNFSTFYHLYKVPAASETIQDPHNWILSLLCQYGPLGLLAFLLALWRPLYAGGRPNTIPVSTAQENHRNRCGFLMVTAVLMLLARPFMMDAEFLFKEDTQSAAFAYVLLYGVPAAVFAGVFYLLQRASGGQQQPSACQTCTDSFKPAILCGILALLIHNLIDFAIFEPGVWGWLWLLIALLISDVAAVPQQPRMLTSGQKSAVVFALVLGTFIYLWMAVIMPLRAQVYFNQALKTDSRRLENLQKSVAADPLSPQAAIKTAGMMAQVVRQADRPNRALLQEAFAFAQIAQHRDPASFKPYRLQAEIASQLAVSFNGPETTEWQTQSLAAYEQALMRYPGSDRLYFEAAQIAETLGKKDTALEYYTAAIEIEEAFRVQFAVMYPDYKKTVSRLGEKNYNLAKNKIRLLSQQTLQ